MSLIVLVQIANVIQKLHHILRLWDVPHRWCNLHHSELHFVSIKHYPDVIMSTTASQITSLTIVYSTVYPDTHQRKHQSSVSLAFVRGIHRGPGNSPHKWPVTRKMFAIDDVIMKSLQSFFPVYTTGSVSPKPMSAYTIHKHNFNSLTTGNVMSCDVMKCS